MNDSNQFDMCNSGQFRTHFGPSARPFEKDFLRFFANEIRYSFAAEVKTTQRVYEGVCWQFFTTQASIS